MLDMTKVELDLVSDVDNLEKGMRISVSYISRRCSKASNKYLASYYSKTETKHITYLDGINLYRYATCKTLSSWWI